MCSQNQNFAPSFWLHLLSLPLYVAEEKHVFANIASVGAPALEVFGCVTCLGTRLCFNGLSGRILPMQLLRSISNELYMRA